MAVARQPVAELWIQQQGGAALVHVGTGPHSAVTKGSREDLRDWVHESAAPWTALVGGGLGLAAAGLVLASVFSVGFLGTIAFGSMITLGGGLTFLGLLKRRGRSPEVRALPAPQSSVQVLVERSRRVRAVLERRGEATFETLLGELRWTERALLETLVQMKENGLVEEDLNLDTGEWVYRAAEHGAVGTPASLMLEDRRVRADTEQG